MKNNYALTDLHLHLDGSLSLASVKELAALQNIEIPNNDEELLEKLQVSEGCRDLNEYLESTLAKNIYENDIYSSTEHYFNVIYENREDFLFLAKCSKEKAVKSIYKVVFENPLLLRVVYQNPRVRQFHRMQFPF